MSMAERDPDKTNPTDSRPRIVWDDSRVRVVQPKVWELAADREEIALLFGTIKDYQAGRSELGIKSAARIVLSPFVAKRLAIALGMEIRRYESKYGRLEQEPPPREENRSPAAPPERPSSYGNQKGDDKAQLIFRLTRDLKVELGFERSFKLSERRLLGNRFLLGMSKKAIEPNPRERILDVCARMNMPGELLESFERYLPDADYIHFGFEKNEKTCIYKAYLEFYEKIKTEVKNTRPKATRNFLMHLGFKWDVADPARRVVTHYTWYPFLSGNDMEEKLSGILDPRGQRTSLEIAKGILGIASRRVPQQDILYLEVGEEGNPRKSFDINLYRADLKLGELYPFLLHMHRHYSIPPERFHALYEQVKAKIFGHLAGGIDREGRDFLTLYYGVQGLRDHDAEAGLPGDATMHRAGADRTVSFPKKCSFSGVEEKDEKARALFRLVNGLDAHIGFERSFKIFRNTILEDRFLMGFMRKTVKHRPHESILNVCRQIHMPEDFLDAFRQHLPESNIVLFGFEGNEKNRLYKAYLEFGHRIGEAVEKNPYEPEPVPIHMGFKWDASDNSKKTATRYTAFPSFNAGDIKERLAAVFYRDRLGALLKIVEGVIDLGQGKFGPRGFLYFEADEGGNPRTSYDINMYQANLQVKELYPFLLDILRHFSIPDPRFHSLYEPVSSHIFGHLTGGIDREGRDFLTLYFGEKGRFLKGVPDPV